MNRALLVGALLFATGCPSKGQTPRPYAALDVAGVVDKLAKARDALTSFRGESTMDYWLSGQRAKGEVLVMGAVGKKVRFAALSPAGGSTLAEMACDGTNFVYLDYQNNCSLTGPCDAKSVAIFFGIELEPDDFVHLALGTPPVVANPTGTVTWDGSKGVERVELKGNGETQKLTIDARENRWDVLESVLVDAAGKTRWSVANTDFEKVSGSGERRVPKKTRFKSPAQNQDLLVEWANLEVNVELTAQQFQIQIPAGLSTCGQKAPSAPSGSPAAPSGSPTP
jgi:outer membrane lipoprotein-sorting protein